MNHIMIDLETMGTRPESAVVAIGAVKFDPETGELGNTLYVPISLKSSVAAGGKIDPDTVMWWLQQDNEARNALVRCDAIGLSAPDALTLVDEFAEGYQVWGNGATFDISMLENMYGKADRSPPWKFWAIRDVRTVVELGESKGIYAKRDLPFEGTPHHALDDAKHQAKYVSAIWQSLAKVTKK